MSTEGMPRAMTMTEAAKHVICAFAGEADDSNLWWKGQYSGIIHRRPILWNNTT